MRKLLLYLLFSLSHGLAMAQYSADDFDENLQSTFGHDNEFAQVIGDNLGSVNHYSGSANIKIPIYTIKQGDFNLPVYLWYNTKGIKVSDESSFIGLGWNLQAGGYIQRSVRGFADDLKFGPGRLHWGFLHENNAEYAENFDVFANPQTSPTYNFYLKHRPDGYTRVYDYEPDIFSFNINGRTCNFVFDKDRKPRCIPASDVKIEYVQKSTTPYDIESFTLTDENGVKYLFDVTEKNLDVVEYSKIIHQQAMPESAFCHGLNYGKLTTVKWYLSKITLPNSETITFSYDDESAEYGSTSFYTTRNCPEDFEFYNRDIMGTHFAMNNHFGTELRQKRIREIIAKNHKITFNINNNSPRQDIKPFGNSNLFAISAIDIYELTRDDLGVVSSSNIKRAYKLDQSYFTSSSGYNLAYSEYNYTAGTGTAIDNKRLRLDALRIMNVATNTTSSQYSFEYNNQYPLPPKSSNEQDLWGYYNHNSTTNIITNVSSAVTLIPKLWVYPNENDFNRFRVYPIANYSGTVFTFNGADRFVNDTYITSGTISKIIYPTGGELTYEYEPNEFLLDGNQNVKGCGIRLKKITSYDGVTHNNDIVKSFSYTLNSQGASSGVLYDMPIYAYTENTSVYENCTKATPTATINGYAFNPSHSLYPDVVNGVPNRAYYELYTLRISHPRFSASTLSGAFMGYKKVTESIFGAAGYTEYTFSTPGAYNQTHDNLSQGCSLTNEGICNGVFENSYVSYHNVTYVTPTTNYPGGINGMILGKGALPFAPVINYDWSRGKILSKKIFSNSSALIKETNYSYSLYSKNTVFSNNNVIGLKLYFSENNYYSDVVDGLGANSFTSPEQTLGFRGRMPIWAKYKIVTDVDVKVSQSEEITYDVVNNKSLSLVNKFYYESQNHTMMTKMEKLVSNGEVLTTYFKYPIDYNTVSSSSNSFYLAVKNLNDNHILSPLIETYTEKSNNGSNARVISGNFFEYKIFPNNLTSKAQLHKVYNLESAVPITGFVPTVINTSGINKNPLYKLTSSKDDYTSIAMLKQLSNRGNLPSSIIWGAYESYPVAQVANATSEQVAYTSFEDGETQSNWEKSTSLGIPNDIDFWTGRYSQDITPTVAGTPRYIQNKNAIPQGDYILSFWCKVATSSSHASSNFDIQVLGVSGSGSPVVTSTKVVSPTVFGDYAYYEYKISNPYSQAKVKIESLINVNLDELRLYPVNAAMKTAAYDKTNGIITECDAANKITRYEYDYLGRLILIRDRDKNIIKKIEHSIQQPE